MNLVKLLIPIKKTRGSKITGETVWASVLKHGNYRLENQPVMTDDLSYHDIVKADLIDNRITFRRLVIKNPSPLTENLEEGFGD